MTDETMDPMAPGPEAPAPEAAPDPTMEQARALYDGLQNLDRRGETLAQVLRPGQDLPPGMDWNQARAALFAMQQAEPEPEADPFDQFGAGPQIVGYNPDGTPVFDQPYQEPAAFDPRDLQPVFESYGQHIEERAFNRAQQWFMQQAQEQGVRAGIEQAATKHQLSDFAKGVVEAMTKQASASQPNRAPGEIADEMAKMYLEDANRRFVAQGGAPAPPRPGVPSGPVPGEQRPTTDAEALEWSRRTLSPGM